MRCLLTSALSVGFLFCSLGLATKPKPVTYPNKNKNVSAPTAPTPVAKLDLSVIAKALASNEAKKPTFGEQFGTFNTQSPQGRGYKPVDPQYDQLMVINQTEGPLAQGISLTVNPKKPLTLRDLERVLGTSTVSEMMAASTLTTVTFPKVRVDGEVEPMAFIAVAKKDLKKTSDVFRVLFRRIQ